MIDRDLAPAQTVSARIAALWRPRMPTILRAFPQIFRQCLTLATGRFVGILEDMSAPLRKPHGISCFDGDVFVPDISHLLGRMTDGERDVTAALPGILLLIPARWLKLLVLRSINHTAVNHYEFCRLVVWYCLL